jgi:16S rRNA (guanine527-N7)-methyltransferase
MNNNPPHTDDQMPEPSADLDFLAVGAAQLGLHLSADQLQQCLRLRALLLEWNERVNLTSITDPQEVLSKHFLDSFSCLLAIPEWNEERAQQERQALSLLDVGSGAGFPGLPLALACPRWQVTLLEATGKKVRFLEAAIAQLDLGSRVSALQGRAEDLAHDSRQRAQYDVVTARSVARLPTLLEYCLPFCRVGGRVIAHKKGEISDEIEHGSRAAATLGGRLIAQHPVNLPGLEDQRVLLVFEATRPAPAQFPRRAGAPANRPLG